MPGGFSRNIPAVRSCCSLSALIVEADIRQQRRIHSHNDYWRDVPLFSALSHGVTSVEADVWLNPKDGRLYVC